VLVVDAVGHLASLYRHGDVAVVGGGYGAGVHNLLEPAAHGRPLVTGPRIGRFREAVLLHDRGALRLAPRPADLPDTVSALLDLAPEQRAALGSAARELVESESGAAERVVVALCGAERG
jgi:3-deoxy-D-manno-octulosonic-acid transferase